MNLRGEVLVVREGSPIAAPLPANSSERPDHDVAVVDASVIYTTDANSAEVVAVVENADLHLQGQLGIAGGTVLRESGAWPYS